MKTRLKIIKEMTPNEMSVREYREYERTLSVKKFPYHRATFLQRFWHKAGLIWERASTKVRNWIKLIFRGNTLEAWQIARLKGENPLIEQMSRPESFVKKVIVDSKRENLHLIYSQADLDKFYSDWLAPKT